MEWNTVKLEIYAPEECIPEIREALHSLGACVVGNYDHVISYTRTGGSWRPLPGAQPYAGQPGELCTGEECKIEARCPLCLAKQALAAVRSVHPYEEPLINVVPLLNDWPEEKDGRNI